MARAGGAGGSARWRVFLSHTSELRNFPAKGNSYVAEAERAIAACGHVVVDMAEFPGHRSGPGAAVPGAGGQLRCVCGNSGDAVRVPGPG